MLNAISCLIRRFDERHTAMNIAWHHQAIVDECGIGGKVAVAVTDSAANMSKAFRVCISGDDNAAASDADADGDNADPDRVSALFTVK